MNFSIDNIFTSDNATILNSIVTNNDLFHIKQVNRMNLNLSDIFLSTFLNYERPMSCSSYHSMITGL